MEAALRQHWTLQAESNLAHLHGLNLRWYAQQALTGPSVVVGTAVLRDRRLRPDTGRVWLPYLGGGYTYSFTPRWAVDGRLGAGPSLRATTVRVYPVAKVGVGYQFDQLMIRKLAAQQANFNGIFTTFGSKNAALGNLFAHPISESAFICAYRASCGAALLMVIDALFGPVPDPPALPLPVLMMLVPAGFPSPADDHIDAQLDLNEHLIRHQAATFFMWAAGDSMVDAGIHSGDLLIVDRAIRPRDGHVVIAVIDGEQTVKYYRCREPHGRPWLEAANREKDYPPIVPRPGQELRVWGVVIGLARSF